MGNEKKTQAPKSKLDSVKEWTLYIIGVLAVLATAFVLVALIIVPLVFLTFGLEGKVTGEYLNTASAIMAVISVILAVYSVWDARRGGKAMEKMVKKLDKLIGGQKVIRKQVCGNGLSHASSTPPTTGGSWSDDNLGH